jgi:glycosyltransferase
MLKVSIITAVLNNRKTIEECMQSIINQTYQHRECIVIDGGSTDGTMDLLKKYENRMTKIVSERDNGIYDAMNKGIKLATGDVIGILNSDDIYNDATVIESVANAIMENSVDSCYADLVYIDKNNPDKVIRYWKSCIYKNGLFRSGWMPPHPTFFVKREVYEKYGCFNTDFKIAADYELMLRFLERHKISTYYIPEVLIKMRMGGMSNRSLKNLFIKSSEDYKAWKINNLNGGIYTILLKNLCKLPQFINK